MAVIYVAVQNVVDTRAAPAPLHARRPRSRRSGPRSAPSTCGGPGDALVEGFRTHWRGFYADPNRLAMAIIAVAPLRAVRRGRRRGGARARALFYGVAGGAARGGRPHPLALGVDRRRAWRCCSSWRAGRGGRGPRACSPRWRSRSASRRSRRRPSGSARPPSRTSRRTSRSRGARTPGRCSASSSTSGRSPASGRAPSSRPGGATRRSRRARTATSPTTSSSRSWASSGSSRSCSSARSRRRSSRLWRVGERPARRGRGAGGVRRARRIPRVRDGERLLAVLVPLLPVRVRRGAPPHVPRRARRSRGRPRDPSGEGPGVPEPVPARRPGAADGDERPDHGPDPVRAGGGLPAPRRRAARRSRRGRGRARWCSTSARSMLRPGTAAASSRASPASSGRTAIALVHAQDLYTNTLGTVRGPPRAASRPSSPAST